MLGSETGVMDVPADQVKRKGRLQPGKLFLVDLERGVIVDDADVKREVASQQPYGEWFEQGIVHLGDLPPAPGGAEADGAAARPPARVRLHAGGPAGAARADRREGRGADRLDGQRRRARGAVSDREPPLFNYFKQLFAQVTNPPIDPIRESIVMSHGTGVGSERNLLEETAEHAHQLAMLTPILFDREIQQLRHVDSSIFKAHTVDITWPVAEGPDGMITALERVCAEADDDARGRHQHPDPERPHGQPRARRDPRAARGRGRASPPRARGHPPADRPRAGVRRAARGPPLRDADRLRRVRDQPVPDARVARGPGRRGQGPRRRGLRDRPVERRQGHRQGPAQDDLQDGHLDDPVLQRGADLRGRRPRAVADRQVLHRDRVADRRHRRAHPRGRDARAPRARLRPDQRRPAAGRRRLRVAPRRRAPHVEPGDDRAPAALRPSRRPADLRRVLQARQRGRGAPGDHARAADVPASCPRTSGSRSTTSSRRARSSSAS